MVHALLKGNPDWNTSAYGSRDQEFANICRIHQGKRRERNQLKSYGDVNHVVGGNEDADSFKGVSTSHTAWQDRIRPVVIEECHLK